MLSIQSTRLWVVNRKTGCSLVSRYVAVGSNSMDQHEGTFHPLARAAGWVYGQNRVMDRYSWAENYWVNIKYPNRIFSFRGQTQNRLNCALAVDYCVIKTWNRSPESSLERVQCKCIKILCFAFFTHIGLELDYNPKLIRWKRKMWDITAKRHFAVTSETFLLTCFDDLRR